MTDRSEEREGVKRELYDRLPNESDAAFRAFVCYRDMGPSRSLAKVADELYSKGKAKGKQRKSIPGNLTKWSSQYKWATRAAAWDAQIDRRAREAIADEIVAMRLRHAQAAMALQGKALQRLHSLDPHSLSPREVRDFLETGVRLERIARGDGSDDAELDSKRINDEARRNIRAILDDDEAIEAAERLTMKLLEGNSGAE